MYEAWTCPSSLSVFAVENMGFGISRDRMLWRCAFHAILWA